MFREAVHRISSDERGAIAATYAIALFGLVAIAGVAFDYARLVAMDTELQNGADQAALAGATQLNGQSGACSRAAAAASALVANKTIMANDGASSAVVIPNEPTCDATGSIRFWQNEAKTTAATSDANAKFIEVLVNARTARYVLTPVVGAFSSPNIRGIAMASVGSAICNSPPVMLCNPEEPIGNTDVYRDFDADAKKGVGVKLLGDGSLSPGSFGFLEADFGNGASNLLAALGWNSHPGDCVRTDGVQIKNGINASAMDGFNVRFDVPGSGNNCPNVGGVTGVCSPSVNARKDLVRANNCNANAWDVNDSNSGNFGTRNYRPTARAVYPSGTTPDIMGHPRDLCHAWSDTGDCNSVNGGLGNRLGTGDWDIQAYWRSNFGAAYSNQVPSSYGSQPKGYPTRYQVYRWEADQIAAGTLTGIIKNAQGSTKAYAQPQAGLCMATASSPYGIVPGGAAGDRRVMTVAVMNCRALAAAHGSLNNTSLEVGAWVDLFLVEPPFDRSKCKGGSGGCNTTYTRKTDVYVEIIGRNKAGGNGSTTQAVRHDTPYLVR